MPDPTMPAPDPEVQPQPGAPAEPHPALAAPAPPIRRWRNAEARAAARRWRARLVALAVATLVAASLVAVAGWFRPPARPTLILVGGPAEGFGGIPEWPADRAALGKLAAFEPARDRGEALGVTEGIAAIRAHPATDPLVVYLCARGWVAPRAGDPDPPAIHLAAPDGPSLGELLAALRSRTQGRTLAILDVHPPPGDPRAGASRVEELAGLVAEAADRAARGDDAAPAILVSCGPGQRPLASAALGRSAFAWSVEQGLGGAADSSGDGRITAGELAAFARDRVDRWAAIVRATAQEPTLHAEPAAGAFPLALAPRRAVEPAGLPKDAAAYPDWLLAAWRERDALAAAGARAEAPRPLGQFEAAILEAERGWRGGLDAARGRTRLADRLAPIRARIGPTRALPHPPPRSLALEEFLGRVPDPAVLVAARAAYADRPRPEPDAKPGAFEAAEARAIADFLDPAKGPNRGGFDLATAAFRVAVEDPEPTPDSIRFIRKLLAIGQPRPAYAETVALSRLADQGRDAWQADRARQQLALARDGELARGRPASLAGGTTALDDAARLRHDAEVVAGAPGYAAPGEVLARLAAARAATAAVLARSAGVVEATGLAGEALARLPAAAPLLDGEPDLERPWGVAADEAAALLDRLERTWAAGAADPADGFDAPLGAEALREALRPFGPEAIAARAARLGRPEPPATAAQLGAILALLDADLPAADARAALWKAGIDAERRLVAAALRPPAGAPPAARASGRDGDPDPAARRVRVATRLLALGGVAVPRGADPTERDVRQAQAWAGLGDQLAGRGAAARDRLARLLPPWGDEPAVDAPTVDPTLLRRAEEFRRLRGWLAERYAFDGRDAAGTDFDRGAARDYAEAGQALDAEAVAVAVDPAGPLDPDHPATTLRLRVALRAGARPTPARVEVAAANADWFTVEPGSPWPTGRDPESRPAADPLRVEVAVGATPVEVPIRLRLRAGSPPAPGPIPPGLVVRVAAGKWLLHRLIPLRVDPAAYQLQAILTADPAGTGSALAEVRLRAAQGKVPAYLSLRNPGVRERQVLVELVDRAGAIAGAAAPVTVRPGESARVTFGPPAAKPDDGFVAVRGPLAVRLTEADRPAPTIARTIPCGLAAVEDYVRVVAARFEPAGPGNGEQARLNLVVRAVGPIAGPPCPVELKLNPGRIPGLVAPGVGNFGGKLVKFGDEVALTVEGVQLAPRVEESGLLDVAVDGIERAIVLRAQLGARAGPSRPVQVTRPALRLAADRARPSAGPLPVGIELDNPGEGGQVIVELGQYGAGGFQAIATTRGEASRGLIRLNPRGPDGALVFEAAARDPSLALDVTQVRGRRLIRGQLLDEAGHELDRAEVAVVLDDQAPAEVELVAPPKYALRGGAVPLRATGTLPESGIREVNFFVGRPVDGKRPAAAAPVPGRPVDADRTTWAAALPLGEAKLGPVEVSAEFIAGVGLARYATATLAVVEAIPVEPGKIRGRVTQGDRPQAAIEVNALDGKQESKGKATTNARGEFEIADIPPGDYEVVCAKATPPTRGSAKVTVRPGMIAAADLPMFRSRGR